MSAVGVATQVATNIIPKTPMVLTAAGMGAGLFIGATVKDRISKMPSLNLQGYGPGLILLALSAAAFLFGRALGPFGFGIGVSFLLLGLLVIARKFVNIPVLAA